MSFDWIRQQFATVAGAEAGPANANEGAPGELLSTQHEDGRPIGPNTMRLRLRHHAERVALVAERRAEAAERARQEAERRRYRIGELDELQVQREFARLRKAARG